MSTIYITVPSGAAQIGYPGYWELLFIFVIDSFIFFWTCFVWNSILFFTFNDRLFTISHVDILDNSLFILILLSVFNWSVFDLKAIRIMDNVSSANTNEEGK